MNKDLINYLDQTQKLFGNKLFSQQNSGSHELDVFYNSIKECTLCDLSKSRTNFVFGEGNPNADLVFIGEAPGKEEDLQGRPFVGRSGKLLDKILKAINLNREKVFILNILKCRPPDNRDPLPNEIDKCQSHLIQQLNIIKPNIIIALGRIAACTLLKNKEQLKNLRNKIHKYNDIDLLVTYHPAALLRNPNLKKYAWEDFKFIRDNYLS